MSFPSYPEYRPAKATWLSSIPAQWEESRLRFFVYINPSKKTLEGLEDNPLVSFLPMEAIGEDGSINLTQTRDADDVKDGYTPVKDGDVVIAKITPCFENGKGALLRGLVSGKGFGTTELVVLRTKGGLAPPFLHYLMMSHPVRRLGEFEMYGAGGQKRVPEDFFRNLRIGVPEKKEQQKIVQFLDYQTAKVDRLIEKQQRLIELLEEKRQAEISLLVTKGLNPTVPYKDSGFSWIGTVPEHWDVIPFKQVTKTLQTGPFGSQIHASDYVEDGIPLINPSHLESGKIYPDRNVAVGHEAAQRLDRHKLKAGDFVFARRGELGRFGLTDSSSEGYLCGTGCIRATPNLTKIDPEFLSFYLGRSEVSEYLKLESVGSTMDNLNPAILGNIPVVIPPLTEQEQIKESIKSKIARFSELEEQANKAVELLGEHRSTLISSTVTGKIDVRDWEPPEIESEESDPAEALNG